jgi:hypothetical protein
VTTLLSSGQVLAGRYRVERVLGEGGMGAVYLCHDLRLPRVWAVKEMIDNFTDPAERQEAVTAFEAEAHILSQLEHPNLPRITDFFSEGGRQYLVMDFVEGETLEHRLGRLGRLPVAEALDIALQVADVLDYLHNRPRPVIFRDLKPANVILTPTGVARLIDFGIARFFVSGKASDTRALGTPGYAAPEQYGRGQSDARTDIFALGATLHHALSGRDPQVDPFNFPPLRQLDPSLPEKLEAIVARAVALNPSERYPSAAAFRQALEELREDAELFPHLPERLRTGPLPAPPALRFDPPRLDFGRLKKGQPASARAVLRGVADGRLTCSDRWLSVQPTRIQGRDVAVQVSLQPRHLESGRYSGAVVFEGSQGKERLHVEVEVEPAHVHFWSLALAFVMTVFSLAPVLGYGATVLLGALYFAAPRPERAKLRAFLAVSLLASLLWTAVLVLILLGVAIWPQKGAGP